MKHEKFAAADENCQLSIVNYPLFLVLLQPNGNQVWQRRNKASSRDSSSSPMRTISVSGQGASR